MRVILKELSEMRVEYEQNLFSVYLQHAVFQRV